MNETLITVLVGAIPGVAIAIIGFLGNLLPNSLSFSLERRRRFETARQEAISEFCDALGDLLRFPQQIAILDDKRVLKYELQQRYFSAMHKAAPYVSPETYKMMSNIDDPISYDPGDRQICDLMKALNAEIAPPVRVSPLARLQHHLRRSHAK